MTADNLPAPAGAGGGGRIAAGGGAAIRDARLAICGGERSDLADACDEFGDDICEAQFTDKTCRAIWRRWLEDPASRCPLDKWGPSEVGRDEAALTQART